MPIIVLYSRMFPPPPFACAVFRLLVFFQARGKDGHARRNERSFPFFFYPPAGIVVVVFMRLFNLEIMTPFFHFLFLFFERERGSEATDRHRSNSLVLFWRLLISGQGLSHSGRILYYIVHNNGRISHRNNYKLKDGFPIEKTI